MYKILSTGSQGNCEIAFNSIAIDMGVPFSVIKPYVNDIQIVLLTHEHGDHINISTIKRLAFERPGLRFGCGAWMLHHMEGIKNVDVYEFGKWYDYGLFKVATGKLFHDVENCFYRIEKAGKKIFRATDTATLEGISAKNYDLYCIEANYDEEYIQEKIAAKVSRNEFAYEKGSINSHLSEQQANDFFYRNKGENSQLIRLHESKIIKLKIA